MVGVEYTVVGWCRNRELLGSYEQLETLLIRLCDVINMRALSVNGVDVRIDLEKKGHTIFHDEGGSSASLILSTSHACIHGWPQRDENRDDGAFFWFSLGSCRAFDSSKVDQVLNDYLKITRAKRLRFTVPMSEPEELPAFSLVQ
jgi:S-adenosylmethionine/arginine decarboxylase-like enzyme